MKRERLDALLLSGRQAYMAAHGTTEWVGRDITDDEVCSLLAAIDAELIRLSDDGLALELTAFPPAAKPRRYLLYGHWRDRAYWSWSEAFIQVGFAAELVLIHDWPASAIGLEVGLDVAAFLPGEEQPVLLAEAKVDRMDLDYVMEVMRAIASDPEAHMKPDSKGREANAVNKYKHSRRTGHSSTSKSRPTVVGPMPRPTRTGQISFLPSGSVRQRRCRDGRDRPRRFRHRLLIGGHRLRRQRANGLD